MGSHSKPKKRASVTMVVGLAGMATAAAVVGLTAGAGTAEARPHWGGGNSGGGTTNQTSGPAVTSNTTTTLPNGNPTTPPVLTGRSGLVPTWKPGTFNPATCTGGTCFVPQSTSPFPSGTTPTAQNPIVANPNGTGLIIGLQFLP
jgi:hypothetical protein